MRRLVIGLLGPVVSIAAIVLVLGSVNLGGTGAAIARAQPPLLAPALLLVALGIVLRSWRWQRLLPIGARPIPVARIAPVLLIGYLGNAVLPARLGEPIRAYLLARREGLSSFQVLGTALLERVVDLAVLALMAFGAAVAIGAPAWVVQLSGIAALGGFVVVVVLTVIGLHPVIGLLGRIAHGLPSADAILVRLDRFATGIGGRSQGVAVAQAALISVPIWLVDATACWVVAGAMGITLAPGAALLIVAVGALGTSIPSAPGYVGTYELASSAAGRAMGLDPASALGLALVLHAVTLIPVAIAGAVSMLLIGAGNLREVASQATRQGDAAN